MLKATDKYLINPRIELFCLSAILILALLSRLPYITRGLVIDEIDTVFYAVDTSSVWQTLSLSVSFNNHLGYSLSARLLEALLGRSEWVFRLPALVLGMASIPVFWSFSRLFINPVFSLLGIFLFTISPLNLLYSTTGRGYSGMIFFTLLSSVLYLRLLTGSYKHRDSILYIIFSVLAIYFHLYSTYVVIIQFLYLCYLRVRYKNTNEPSKFVSKLSFQVLTYSFIAIVSLSILLYLPALPNFFHDLIVRGKSSFDPIFPWSVFEYLSGSKEFLFTALILVFSILGVITIQRTHYRESLYFYLLLIIPLITMWITRPFDLYPRFFIYWLPYLLLFFVAGLSSFWYSFIGDNQGVIQNLRRLIILITIIAVTFYWTTSWNEWIPQDGFRDASRAIVLNSDSSVAFCAIGGDPEVFQYYFHQQIFIPQSFSDFLELSNKYSEVRCVYYPASWELPAHTQIAKFLKENGSWSQAKNVLMFTYRK